VDVEDQALMRSRSWRWLRARIVALLNAETRLNRHFAPPDKEADKAEKATANGR
jgi:hypothetical protein